MDSKGILLALQLLIDLGNQVKAVGALLGAAHERGTDITPDELAGLKAHDDDVRKALNDAVAALTPAPPAETPAE